ncbi:MAG: hypothetical protein NVSMB3_03690 [Acidobacteriaceae bacterium]
MDRELTPSQHSADLAARQDRLERQVAELSTQLRELERRIFPAAAPEVSRPPVPPPPFATPVHESSEAVGEAGRLKLPARASLEDRIGSQLFNRVGIIALLIGVTWFLKLAVDNRWIGAGGRVLTGMVAGAGLVLWSERFRRKGFPAFSYSLKAIGSGVLYLALWASFQLYHLLPGGVALGAMLLVTAWNAYMAWSQNAELLAGYALAGGLATPLLLSTGGDHEIFLFTYLLAIDVAAVTLSRLKRWPRLPAAALPATAAYFIGWFSSFYAPPALGRTSLFIVFFFATFTVAAFDSVEEFAAASSAAGRRNSLFSHLLLPFGTAAFTSLALYSVLQDAGHHDLLPWLMVAMSAVYLGLLRLRQTTLAAAAHLALAIVFFTIAIPLKADGAWITVGWLVEGVALLWVSTRFPDAVLKLEPGRVLRSLAVGALLLGLGGVLTELVLQSLHAQPGFFNRAFGTAVAGLACFGLSVAVAGRGGRSLAPGFREIAAGTLIAFNLTAVLAGVVQITSLGIHGAQGVEDALERALAVSAFLMLYGAILLAVGFWRRNAFVRWQALFLLVFTIAKTFVYDMRNLSQGYRVLSFLGLGALLMTVSFAYQKDWLALREATPISAQPRGGLPE